jgi:hypothetical protein
VLACALAIGACSDSGNNANGDGGGGGGSGAGGGGGGGGGTTVLGGVDFPWKVYDGSVPDVPPSTTGKTYYCDPVNGNDANDGSSIDKAKRTFGAALARVRAGDTILLAGGVYRERPDFNSISGTASAPITIGSYGHGTGRPILDGGVKPNPWTRHTAQGQNTVWRTSTAGLADFANAPVLGVYVGSTRGELALKEVIHGQVQRYESDPLPPNQTQADIKDGSGAWYYDAAAKVLYADFGKALGNDDPNNADVSLIYSSANSHQPLIVLTAGHDYINFVGLAVRAASWHGVYSEASHITFDHCDMKFNGGGGIFFGAGETDTKVTDNRVIETRIWMNVLDNWPRFNNGNTGGGWPGALSWYSQSNALSRGNLVYQNGGEGLIVWGTNSGSGGAHVAMNNRVLNNVIFDNWSVNLYIDNTQNTTVEQNFVFNHPRDPSTTFDGLLEASTGYREDFGKRLTPVNLSLADEPGSAYDGQAHLAGITVINNIFAGSKFGFVDYDDGTSGTVHGLKSCLIANNTIVLTDPAVPGQTAYGWRHLFAGGPADGSRDSFFQNNLIVVSASADRFIDAGRAGSTGITCDDNLYSGPGGFGTADRSQTFAAWKSAHPGWDTRSKTADALLEDAAEFSQTALVRPVFDWRKAAPKAGSPARGGGADLSSRFSTDFTGATRGAGAFDVGALPSR